MKFLFYGEVQRTRQRESAEGSGRGSLREFGELLSHFMSAYEQATRAGGHPLRVVLLAMVITVIQWSVLGMSIRRAREWQESSAPTG